MINVYALGSSAPSQIQHGRFRRALARKFGDMIRDQVRIIYPLIFLWRSHYVLQLVHTATNLFF